MKYTSNTNEKTPSIKSLHVMLHSHKTKTPPIYRRAALEVHDVDVTKRRGCLSCLLNAHFRTPLRCWCSILASAVFGHSSVMALTKCLIVRVVTIRLHKPLVFPAASPPFLPTQGHHSETDQYPEDRGPRVSGGAGLHLPVHPER